jgi:sec-independent protein translocase protein TatA
MFGIGISEVVVILVICLFLFDPKKLPEIARFLGKAVRELKKLQKSFMEDDQDKPAG